MTAYRTCPVCSLTSLFSEFRSAGQFAWAFGIVTTDGHRRGFIETPIDMLLM